MWNQRKRWGVVIAAILLAVVLTGPDVYAASDETSADVAAVPIGNGARMVTEEGYLKLHPPVVYNPLTGIEGYNEAAVGKRPIALVVENDPKARPQWGIDDPEKSNLAVRIANDIRKNRRGSSFSCSDNAESS